MVWKFRGAFQKCGSDLDDMRQQVALALLARVHRYNPNLGATLFTYLYSCARFLVLRQILIESRKFEARCNRIDVDLTEIADCRDGFSDVDINDMFSYAFRFATPRQKFILERRRRGMTLGEIGAELKVTRERIRQLEAKGLYHAAFAARNEAYHIRCSVKECWL
jgi:RNA polymerase sigma factor (sigma-70 family)